jgi:hypothetical protein
MPAVSMHPHTPQPRYNPCDTRQTIDEFAPVEMWNTTLECRSLTLWVNRSGRESRHMFAQWPNCAACALNFNSRQHTLERRSRDHNTGTNYLVPYSRAGRCSYAQRCGTDGSGTPTNILVSEIRPISVLAFSLIKVESIIVAQNHSRRQLLDAVLRSASRVDHFQRRNRPEFLWQRSRHVHHRSESSAPSNCSRRNRTTPYAWTYVVRPLSKSRADDTSTHTSDLWQAIGGSPYILYTLHRAAPPWCWSLWPRSGLCGVRCVAQAQKGTQEVALLVPDALPFVKKRNRKKLNSVQKERSRFFRQIFFFLKRASKR